MIPKTLKGLLIFFAALAVAGLLVVFAAQRSRERPLSVVTAHAIRSNFTSWVESNGKVEPVEPHVIQAEITGFIRAISSKEGQSVSRSQVLMTLDGEDVREALAHAKEQLTAAEDQRKIAAGGGSPSEIAQLQGDLAKADLEIASLSRDAASEERLYSRQAATRQEVEQAESALAKTQADKRLIQQKIDALGERSKTDLNEAALREDEARISIQSLEQKLKASQVIAPTTGTVYSLPAREGTLARVGDVLAEMADLRNVRVRAYVDETDLASVQTGQLVEITWDAQPGRTWSGRVEQLPKTIVARGSRNVAEVLCSFDAAGAEFLPNTNVNVRIRTAERDNALTLARGAVKTEAGKHYVFIAAGGRLHKQEVVVGAANATDYEILKGVTDRDAVVLPGGEELRDGMPVTGVQ